MAPKVTAMLGVDVTASFVRIKWEIIHGCLPSSVTIQPASSATKPRGLNSTRSLMNPACLLKGGLLQAIQPANKANTESKLPQPTMIWKQICTAGTLGQSDDGS